MTCAIGWAIPSWNWKVPRHGNLAVLYKNSFVIPLKAGILLQKSIVLSFLRRQESGKEQHYNTMFCSEKKDPYKDRNIKTPYFYPEQTAIPNMTKPFKFKQFEIHQDRCAMKIGTDGVLLGAWTEIDNNTYNILDIGSGTGIIALMLAQRSAADNIEAIELDGDAFEQCTENFENSPWGDRLFCFHAGFDEFVDEYTEVEPDESELYDLIVSNPPFYKEDVTSGDSARDAARQNTSLPFDELVEGVSKLLTKEGSFSTIIPFKEESRFIALAAQNGLHPSRITRVKGTQTADTKRSLLQFSFIEHEIDENELIIEAERHQYTNDYTALTQAFYLNM
ncbi:tRNA1(Val) (adenine(37)-N6)-methyltransferase [Maribacter aquimaris]|nr:methyltransferase [Maribacter aquimaris]